MMDQRVQGKVKLISTGFDDLDRILDGGYERGTLNIIAGRPGMGKTAGVGGCTKYGTSRNIANPFDGNG